MTSTGKKISKGEIEKLLLKHPDHVPIIVNYDKGTERYRFIVKSEITIMQFLCIFRRRSKLSSNEALWLYVKDASSNKKNQAILPPTTSTLSSIYDQYRDDKLILYFEIEKENVFG